MADLGEFDDAIFISDHATLVIVQDGAGSSAQFMAIVDFPEVIGGFGAASGLAAGVMGRPSMRYATATAPALVHGSVVLVKGKQYKVREPHLEGDGRMSVADLAAA